MLYPDVPPLPRYVPSPYAQTPAQQCTAVDGCPRRWVGILRSSPGPQNRIVRAARRRPPPIYYCVEHVRDAVQKMRNG